MDDEQNSIIESILKPLTTLFSTDLKAIPEESERSGTVDNDISDPLESSKHNTENCREVALEESPMIQEKAELDDIAENTRANEMVTTTMHCCEQRTSQFPYCEGVHKELPNSSYSHCMSGKSADDLLYNSPINSAEEPCFSVRKLQYLLNRKLANDLMYDLRNNSSLEEQILLVESTEDGRWETLIMDLSLIDSHSDGGDSTLMNQSVSSQVLMHDCDDLIETVSEKYTLAPAYPYEQPCDKVAVPTYPEQSDVTSQDKTVDDIEPMRQTKTLKHRRESLQAGAIKAWRNKKTQMAGALNKTKKLFGRTPKQTARQEIYV